MFSGFRSVCIRLRSCKTRAQCQLKPNQGRIGDIQATLVKSCRAKLWIWLLGKGTNPLPLRKSKTLWPRRSVTIQMWLRKSKQSRRCMHLFRFCRSLWDKVCSTRSSMREASRYFCTDRMILIAHFDLVRLSKASTTLPKVPWPRSLLTWSGNSQHPVCVTKL